MKVDERIKERQNIINEFEKLVKDLSGAGIHIKKRPNDYNEPHYLIYESEELHLIAEMYARIGPTDDGTVDIYMLGSPLEQRIVRFIKDNVTDEEARKKIIRCVKENMPKLPEEKKIREYFTKEAEKFKHIKLKLHNYD